jgi:hypothetical protein
MNTEKSMNQSKDTLRIFLREEIDNAEKRLQALKGSLKAEDFNTLEEELKERSETLDSLLDEDETQLFILRRQLGLLRENMETLAVKQSWWARLPLYGRIMLFTVPVVLYLLVLSLVQWANKGNIYDYPATQTAIASQTMLPTLPATNAQATLPGPTAAAPSTPTTPAP